MVRSQTGYTEWRSCSMMKLEQDEVYLAADRIACALTLSICSIVSAIIMAMSQHTGVVEHAAWSVSGTTAATKPVSTYFGVSCH